MLLRELISEEWSDKYKRSINCNNPKGFSQKAHCAGRKKHNENFADGRNPQDKGDSKRYNVPTKGSVSSLRKIAKQGGRRGQLAHWMANMKAGRKKANEDIGEHDIMKAFRDFLPIAMHVLKIDKLPRIKLSKQVDDSDQPTFGRFINDTMIIEVGIANRHILDILRTLAHELTHFKQFINHRIGPHSGDTGSPEENEAHAVAGVIMRFFNKKHPHYFADKPLELSETATAGATTAAAVSVGPIYKNKKAKQIKKADGTSVNALDLPGGNLLTGMTIAKR
jgi:hypothetical protein